jgi:type II secretory pathway pseudopilin PulG
MPLRRTRPSVFSAVSHGPAVNVAGGSRTPGRLRRGLSLLEILLATVILLGALASLSQQTSTGITAALRSQLETEAALRCTSQLNRLVAESRRESSIPETPFSDNSQWRWSASWQPSEFPGLQMLDVTVWQQGPHRTWSTFSLRRLCAVSDRLPADRSLRSDSSGTR